MIDSREIAQGLGAVWRLARRDSAGLALLDNSVEGCGRSFWAAVLVAPAFAIIAGLRLAELPDADFGRFALVQAIGYVIEWTAYPVLMFHLTGLLGRRHWYARHIVAYNWASVLQMAAYLPATLIGLVLPPADSAFIGMAVTGAVLFFQWVIARTTLEIGVGQAIGLVVVDVLLSLLTTGIADRLS